MLLKKRSTTRVASLLIFLILLGTLIIGYSPASPTTGGASSPILLIILLFIFFITTFSESYWELDNRNSTVIKKSRLLFFTFNFTDDDHRVNSGDEVTLRIIPITKEGQKRGLFSFLSRNRSLYKLFIRFGEKNIFIEESVNYEELQGLGQELGAFLKIKYKEETLDY